MTGGSAVAMPLPDYWLAESLISNDAVSKSRPEIAKPAIILSGSCSAMTNKQVANYTANAPGYQIDPLALSESGYAQAVEWMLAQAEDVTPIVYATADPDSVAKAQAKLGIAHAGEIVEQALAAVAVAARDRGTRRFIVAGGETSGAITKSLGIDRFDVGEEITAGVAWCYAVSENEEIAITLKSGNFGSETFFTDALSKLEQA